jgi:hypothetical protein
MASGKGAKSRKGAKRKAADDLQTYGQSKGKRPKLAKETKGSNGDALVTHALLSQYYPRLQTLRDYLLCRLPKSSRLRRKKISSIGRQAEPRGIPSDIEHLVCRALDTTLVGTFGEQESAESDNRWEEFISFSQRGDESYVTLSEGLAGSAYFQSEVRTCSFLSRSNNHLTDNLDSRLCRMAFILQVPKRRRLAEAHSLRWLSEDGSGQSGQPGQSHSHPRPHLYLPEPSCVST